MDDSDRLLADAVMTLSEDARWEAHDLVSRRGVAAAVDLLRGHSGELALSRSAGDQLFGLALDQAAAALADGAAIPRVDLSAYLTPCPLPEPRLDRIRSQAAAFAAANDARLTVKPRGTAGGPAPRRRMERSRDAALAVRQTAALNRLMWSDARLALGDHDRALMLAAAEAFEAAAGSAAPRGWWRRLMPRWPFR